MKDDLTQYPAKLNKIRFMLVWVFWAFILCVALPTIFLGMINSDLRLVKPLLDLLSSAMMCGISIYILFQIWNATEIIQPVLLGMILSAISKTSRVLDSVLHFNEHLTPFWQNFRFFVVENGCGDIGVALIIFGLFFAVLQMLQAKYKSAAEHEILLSEITERIRAERALRESEVKYRQLVENANSIILRLDQEGRILFANEFAEQYFGYTEEELLGENTIGLITPPVDSHGYNQQNLIDEMRREPERFVAHENENMRRNGERVWIAWTNRPVYNEQGDVTEFLCIGNDVTERKRAEQIIAEQRVQIINASRLSALGVMASGVAHEINNPLAILAMANEQLERTLALPEINRQHVAIVLSRISRNITRIEHIVRGLRNLSRDGAQEPFRHTSVRILVADILEVCRERFKAHNVFLDIPDISASLEIECRATQLGQVLLNLLHNAYDAVESLPEKWVRIDVTEFDDTIEFSVTDSGTGVADDIRERVLEPFFTTKEAGKGSGLGLSISKRIIEDHSGDLRIDATCPNTRFVVRLPKNQTSPTPPLPPTKI